MTKLLTVAKLDAVVVGSGPNGLVAAVTLARAGRSVVVFEANDAPGGGMRSEEVTLPGFIHDICSTAHPFIRTSPAMRDLKLLEQGIDLVDPDIVAAHPMDDGTAALLFKSVADTSRSLGDDADEYRSWANGLVRHWDDLAPAILGPVLRVPRHPVALAGFGLRDGVRSVRSVSKRFTSSRGRALIAGLGAHSMRPFGTPTTGGLVATLTATAHIGGWPFVRGGTQQVTKALIAMLEDAGGEILCGHRVTALTDIPPATAVLWDTDPRQLADVAATELPARYVRQLQNYRFGAAAFKIDYALSAPIPWAAADCARAGTVHVGGTYEEIAASESASAAGRHSDRPFVLVTQPTLFDSSRAPQGKHVAWAYCHVPNGSDRDVTEILEGQIERFAPGFRDVVLERCISKPSDLTRHNSNYVGGDIATGAMTMRQVFFRPTIGFSPHRTPNRRHYICSAATPPGPGTHGMCGARAAEAALKHSLR